MGGIYEKSRNNNTFGEFNFGNRLQNYAVQEVLKKHGLDVETIKYIGLNDTGAVAIQENDIQKNRLEKFKKFNENLKFSDYIMYKEYDVPSDFKDKYDYFFMGSDQIWNFTFKDIFSNKVFAEFAPREKKIAISASFGIDYLPEKNTQLYDMCKKDIEDIKAISVREDAGKEIVEKLTGRTDAKVLIDPTMMVKTEDWEKVMKKPENLKTDKFIVKSFLGDTDKRPMEEIQRIAKENDCEIIDISDSNSKYYNMGPAEFLYLEKNAFLVATDSFHASVFSILFSTPFIVFKRNDPNLQNMYSRLETLLKTFKMENRVFDGKICDEIFNNDYSKSYEILEEKRKEAYDFIENSIK